MTGKLPNTVATATAAGASFDYKYQCEKCQNKYKNRILLAKHICANTKCNTSKWICPTCSQQFQNKIMLNIHKNNHVKSTSVLQKPSDSIICKTMIEQNVVFKCILCNRICSSKEELKIHTKKHKEFKCLTCGNAYSEKFLLDLHLQNSCMKSRKSTTMEKTPKKPKLTTVESLRFECGECKKKFLKCTNLYIHQVEKHGLNTPNKSLINKTPKKLYKTKAPFGGIPTNPKLRKACAELTQKMVKNFSTID